VLITHFCLHYSKGGEGGRLGGGGGVGFIGFSGGGSLHNKIRP
jgi:hypothetical protein